MTLLYKLTTIRSQKSGYERKNEYKLHISTNELKNMFACSFIHSIHLCVRKYLLNVANHIQIIYGSADASMCRVLFITRLIFGFGVVIFETLVQGKNIIMINTLPTHEYSNYEHVKNNSNRKNIYTTDWKAT